MARTLTGGLATLGSAPVDASIGALSENVYLLASQSWFWVDISILSRFESLDFMAIFLVMPIPSSRMVITPHWWQIGRGPSSRSRALLESSLEWCVRTWCDGHTLREGRRGGVEGPKITMAKALIDWQTALGCRRGMSRSPIHGLSGNVYFNGVLTGHHGDTLIRTGWVPCGQGTAPILDIERQ